MTVDRVIGIDLGATRIKAFSIDVDGNQLHQHIEPTPDIDDTIWKNAVAWESWVKIR